MSSKPDASLAHEGDTSGTALLIIDMISCWDFPDADAVLDGATTIYRNIALLKQRCRREGVPAIYCNDNSGRWRSDFRHLVSQSSASQGRGADITQALMPDHEDFFVLKPKHSAFFSTPLELLLSHLRARRVIVTGVSSDQCILVTVAEARMRDFDVVVASDCVASQSKERNDAALLQFRQSYKLPTTVAAEIALP
ncbi:MAG: putative isochorismatase hydrolase [Variovorax sp.]|nr:putative isochorismatase hydrolase [Variovorax sp.]